MSFAVIASKAGFKSAATELLLAGAPELVFRLVGAVVHESAKLSIAANETIAWIRFFIFQILDSVVGFVRMFYAETRAQVNEAEAKRLASVGGRWSARTPSEARGAEQFYEVLGVGVAVLCLKSLLVAWLRDVGSAAGCEAGLCPAVIVKFNQGLCPWFGLCPQI